MALPQDGQHSSMTHGHTRMPPISGDSSTRRQIRWLLLPWAVLAVGVPASFVLFSLIQDAVEDVARLRFERNASDAKHVIEARVRSYTEVLRGLAALFTGERPVDRVQFHRFVRSLDLKNRYPGFDVVNYAIHVPASNKAVFEQSVRHDRSLNLQGYPEFAIRPPGNRPEYHVVVYVEPMEGFEFAFGLDLSANPAVVGTEPHALMALQHAARDSGQLTASGRPIRIKAASEYIGLAMRQAVYRGGVPLDSVEERRKAYLGSVGAGINVEKLMDGVLGGKSPDYLRFSLHDIGSAAGESQPSSPEKGWILFDSKPSRRDLPTLSAAANANKIFRHALPMEVGGRQWQVHFSAPRNAIIERTDALLPWIVLAGGLLSSMLLSGMFYFLASSRSRAVKIASEITRDLRDSTEQIQAMSRQLVEVQETERRQFSRELHDRVGQNLTALSINLDILKSQVSANGNDSFKNRLNDAAALLESTADAIENVMSELRPPMLDDYGLLPALQWYSNEFYRRTGIRVSVEGDERMKRLPQTSEIALFRIAQEALNNVAKHAHAGHVEIAINRAPNELVMIIADDGIGLDAASPASARRRPGIGMVTMRERTQAVQGRFEIAAAPGGGTRIEIRVPG